MITNSLSQHCSLHSKDLSRVRVACLSHDVAGGKKGRMAGEGSCDHTVRAWELSTDPRSLDLPAWASGGTSLGGRGQLQSPVFMLCVREGSGTQSVKVSSAMGKRA